MALIQMPNFSCTKLKPSIILKYFVSRLTKQNIFLLLNLVQLESRLVFESTQAVEIVWVGLNSNKVQLMKSLVSEPT